MTISPRVAKSIKEAETPELAPKAKSAPMSVTPPAKPEPPADAPQHDGS